MSTHMNIRKTPDLQRGLERLKKYLSMSTYSKVIEYAVSNLERDKEQIKQLEKDIERLERENDRLRGLIKNHASSLKALHNEAYSND